MTTADIANDRLIHLVAAHAHAARIHDAAQGQHRHLRGPTANINDHGPGGFGDRQTGTDGRRHGFFNQVNLAGTRALCRFLDRAALYRCRT